MTSYIIFHYFSNEHEVILVILIIWKDIFLPTYQCHLEMMIYGIYFWYPYVESKNQLSIINVINCVNHYQNIEMIFLNVFIKNNIHYYGILLWWCMNKSLRNHLIWNQPLYKFESSKILFQNYNHGKRLFQFDWNPPLK